MKKLILLCCIVYVFFLPVLGFAQDHLSYITAKPGIYSYEGDLDEEHNIGFNAEIAYGYYVQPHLVLEGGVGYFHDGVGNGNDIRGNDIMLSIKRVYYFNRYEPFIGGGVGVYFVNYQGVLKEARNRVPMDVDETVYGGHILAGVNLNFHSNLFLGIEGKYIFTGDADFNGAKVNLDGFASMAVLGYRF